MGRGGSDDGSDFGDQHLAAERLRRCLRQHLPGHSRIALAHLREHRPEVGAGIAGLHGRIGHLKLRALVAGGLGLVEALIRLHLGGEAVLGGLDRVGPLRTVEIGHVVGQQVGIGQQEVVGSIVFRGGADDIVRVAKLLLNTLQLLHGLSGVLRLGQQGILDDAGVAIQQCRGLSTEVLENLKTFVADACQVLVGAALALGLRLAVRRGRCRGRVVSLRLWEC